MTSVCLRGIRHCAPCFPYAYIYRIYLQNGSVRRAVFSSSLCARKRRLPGAKWLAWRSEIEGVQCTSVIPGLFPQCGCRFKRKKEKSQDKNFEHHLHWMRTDLEGFIHFRYSSRFCSFLPACPPYPIPEPKSLLPFSFCHSLSPSKREGCASEWNIVLAKWHSIFQGP